MSAGSKARRGMFTFVGVIFVLGLVIAGAYVFVLKPGETANQPASEVVNPSG